jgi:hypothetical protein
MVIREDNAIPTPGGSLKRDDLLFLISALETLESAWKHGAGNPAHSESYAGTPRGLALLDRASRRIADGADRDQVKEELQASFAKMRDADHVDRIEIALLASMLAERLRAEAIKLHTPSTGPVPERKLGLDDG